MERNCAKEMEEENWAVQMAREQAMRDYRVVIETAREEGKKEGKKEGREEGKRLGKIEVKVEMARALMKLGVEIEKIVQASGLTREELEKL